MNHITPVGEASNGAGLHRLRDVHRASAELRRGAPVLLEAADPLILLAAETATADSLAELGRLAAGPPVLLLASMRAAAVLGHGVDLKVVALALPDELLDPTSLRSLADPTADQVHSAGLHLDTAPIEAPASLALAKLARLLPAVLAAPAREDAALLAGRMKVLAVPARDIIGYPAQAATDLVRVAEAAVPLEDAPDARIVAFRAPDAGIEHLAIIIGDPRAVEVPLVRVHSECFTGDLLGSLRCDCGPQLRGAIRRIAQEGAGVVLYLSQEGRGIGLVNKLRAYTLQDRGLDTYDANGELGWGADERNYLAAATMLELLGLHRVRLLTNNPDKLAALRACGVDVAGRESHVIAPNGVNDRYLSAKATRFGHWLK
jgi:GTP cyclohydrolase II